MLFSLFSLSFAEMLYLNLQCGEPRQESAIHSVQVFLRLVHGLAIALYQSLSNTQSTPCC